jgi:hypothetical protein
MSRTVEITELALHDGHQNLLATRMALEDMVAAFPGPDGRPSPGGERIRSNRARQQCLDAHPGDGPATGSRAGSPQRREKFAAAKRGKPRRAQPSSVERSPVSVPSSWAFR